MFNQDAYQKLVLNPLSEKTVGDITPSDDVCRRLLNSLFQSIQGSKRFYLALDIRDFSLFFQHNLPHFFDVKGYINMQMYMSLVHHDYVKEYLDWGAAVYEFAVNDICKDFLKRSYKIMKPMKTLKGFYWVLQESFPLQVDTNGHMVTQFNEYTLIAPYETLSMQSLNGVLCDEGYEDAKNTKLLHRLYLTKSGLRLTNAEKTFLELYIANPTMPYKIFADILFVKESTIIKHSKNIIAKAKIAFPSHFGNNRITLKEIVTYIYDYLE
jgi:hypothetical protein